MITVYVLAGLVILRLLLLAAGAALIIRPITSCPACFDQTFKLQRVWLRRLLPMYEWRWCPHCGWEGASRVTDAQVGSGAELHLRKRGADAGAGAD